MSISDESRSLASFDVANMIIKESTANLSSGPFLLPALPLFFLQASRLIVPSIAATGSYSRLYLSLIFQRQMGFYMTQIYLPSMLVVVISWVRIASVTALTDSW